ncbi:MAG: diguanylate cyclase, partial [Lachnospiraceae bacterium]|nr:diguanylate cyclase [Lachnospiraceae bacterium]
VDGYRTAATEGIPITDGMKITFHTMSLPTARLVWHCAFMDIFYSSDKKQNGDDYKEYALIRLDGESWEAVGTAENKLIVNLSDEFDGWAAWKERNKKGIDVTVSFTRKGNKITTFTENQGISIKNITTILQEAEDVYVGFTGDQCTITNIRVTR